jgi:hypothetical protein
MDVTFDFECCNVETARNLLLAHTVSYQSNNFLLSPGEELGGRSSAVSDIRSCIETARDAKVAKKFLPKTLRNPGVLSDLCGK